MGQPVVHFEITGADAAKLHSYYGELFDWEVNADNPMNYGVVQREANSNADGIGIGGGIGGAQGGGPGQVTFYVEVPDVGASLAKAEELGGKRIFGPDEVPGTGVELGQFADPEGHVIGLMKAGSPV